MSRNDSCGGGSCLFAFIFGALVGAGAVALLSPASGEENRRKLSELKDEFMEKSSDLRDEAHEKFQETRGRIDETVGKGKEFVDKQKSILSTAIEAGKEAYNRERESHSPDEA